MGNSSKSGTMFESSGIFKIAKFYSRYVHVYLKKCVCSRKRPNFSGSPSTLASGQEVEPCPQWNRHRVRLNYIGHDTCSHRKAPGRLTCMGWCRMCLPCKQQIPHFQRRHLQCLLDCVLGMMMSFFVTLLKMPHPL